MQESFKEQISLAEIAEFIQIHPVHLAQTFRRFRHTTIGNYLRELRLQNAQKELLETKKSLSEIAMDNGFSDQSHLSRLFKQKTGVSPKEYRQKFKS